MWLRVSRETATTHYITLNSKVGHLNPPNNIELRWVVQCTHACVHMVYIHVRIRKHHQTVQLAMHAHCTLNVQWACIVHCNFVNALVGIRIYHHQWMLQVTTTMSASECKSSTNFALVTEGNTPWVQVEFSGLNQEKGCILFMYTFTVRAIENVITYVCTLGGITKLKWTIVI